MLFEKLAIAFSVMFLCTLIHALFMLLGNHLVDWRLPKLGHARSPLRRVVLVWMLIMLMFIGICIQAGIWAFVYVDNTSITALTDVQSAFYFSLVTYTTLGYGDIVLQGDWRILSAIQSANGAIIFGWTTALIFGYIQRIYKAVEPVNSKNHV